MEKTISFVPPLPTRRAEEQLGFSANTVIVNNPTASYYYLPDVNYYVQPYTQQAIIPLYGTQVARIEYTAPPGLTNPSIVDTTNSVACTFRFLDAALPPDSGLALAGANVGRGVLWQPYDAIAGFTFLAPLRQSCPDGLTFVPRYNGVAPLFLSNLLIGVTMPDIAVGGAITLNSYGASAIHWIGTGGVGLRTPPIHLAGFFPAGCSIQITCSTAHSGYLVA